MADKGIVHVIEKVIETLTAKELEELAQTFFAKCSELMSTREETDEQNNYAGRKETSTILGNLVNLARPGMEKFQKN